MGERRAGRMERHCYLLACALCIVLPCQVLCQKSGTSQAMKADEGWRLATGTHYGAPASFARPFDKKRGEGSFGILAFGSCGFTEYHRDNTVKSNTVGLVQGNVPATIPYALDAIGAAADMNEDYPGTCGRCYAFRCKTGYLLNKEHEVMTVKHGTYETGQPVLFDIDDTIKDSNGRSFPGNKGKEEDRQYIQCWEDGRQVVVRIVDSCPCLQKLPGEVRRQEWCCGGIDHFDLSYYAFEKLAHPLYGVIMMEYRPVDCFTQQPLPLKPGYVSPNILGKKGPEAGWSWFPWDSKDATFALQGIAPGGYAASCVEMSPGGGIGFNCRECEREGYKPFKGKTAVSFWIKSNSNSTDPFYSSSLQGEVPPLKAYLVHFNENKFCNEEVRLNETKPDGQEGDWFKFRIPLSRFRCTNPPAVLENMTKFEVQNLAERRAFVCLANLRIE